MFLMRSWVFNFSYIISKFPFKHFHKGSSIFQLSVCAKVMEKSLCFFFSFLSETRLYENLIRTNQEERQ